MKTLVSPCLALVVATGLSLSVPGAAPAQSLFAPYLVVNDKVITQYELAQRTRFLTLLGAPGDVAEQARKALIDDKLRLDAAELVGIKATDKQIRDGMDEFASRADMTGEQFVAELGKAGVDAETFRDFVEAGLIWRELVRAKFGDQARPTEVAVDRAITNQTRRAAVKVLLSELIIPAPPGQEAEAMALAERLQREARGETAFAQAARTYSAAPSAERGGRIEWLPLQNLPPTLGPILLTLQPGEVSDPLKIPNAVAIFQLRALDETTEPAPDGVEVDYAELRLPNDDDFAAQVARVRSETDNCDDLYTLFKGSAPDQLRRVTAPMASVAQDVALDLAKLDAGEVSAGLQGASGRVLMLCARRPISAEPIDRGRVAQVLVNQSLGALAESYLADLRANAIIREP